MLRSGTLWKANLIAFICSFCVMVLELVASRILSPYIGSSLYTWTSIIGVILAGIAIGNYMGGKIADRYPFSLALATLLIGAGLLSIVILPATQIVASIDLFGNFAPMLNFTFKTVFIFFFPAIILSMITPLVIKLTLADLEQTGGVVGTIYACSTAGAIFGTFMTGFYLILWLGTRMIVWLVAGILLVMGIGTLFFWKQPAKEAASVNKAVKYLITIVIVAVYFFLFHQKESWKQNATRESNYFAIEVVGIRVKGENIKALHLNGFDQSYVIPEKPEILVYAYLNVFKEMVGYLSREVQTFRILHLGGGGYCFPRYMESVYPGSINDVVEIDPAVTEVAHALLGLPLSTSIRTYNQDARRYLIERNAGEKYNVVIGDVFNDYSTPYHLSTLEFNRLVKSHMQKNGIYMLNVNDYEYSKYTPSFIHTLKQVFKNVYLFNVNQSWEKESNGNVLITSVDRIIIATDRHIDLTEYMNSVTENGKKKPVGYPLSESLLQQYLMRRGPLLLTDDYAPTDILLAPIVNADNLTTDLIF